MAGAAVTVHWKDGVWWMHGMIVEPIGNDCRGCSYTTWVMKTGRLITCSTEHTLGTTILSEKYLQEQIKKAPGRLEAIFMQVIPIEKARPP